MSKATNVELIEQSAYIDIYRIDYKIINQEEEHCSVGDVILNNCIVEKFDDPKDYTYELKIAGGELSGNAISMTWYTNRINEVIAKYNI